VTAQPAPPAARSSTPEAPEAASPPLPPPAERGATVIPDKVVARLATRAAREALARQLPSPGCELGAPRASAEVSHGSARLRVALDLPYPVDIAHVSRGLRQGIAERVGMLTGLPVDDIVLTVRRLIPAGGPGRGRVR
jgi:hypothetical protein